MINLPSRLTSFPLIDGGVRGGAACSWQSVCQGPRRDLTLMGSAPVYPCGINSSLSQISLSRLSRTLLGEPPSTLISAGDPAAGHFFFPPRNLLNFLFYLSGFLSLSLSNWAKWPGDNEKSFTFIHYHFNGISAGSIDKYVSELNFAVLPQLRPLGLPL